MAVHMARWRSSRHLPHLQKVLRFPIMSENDWVSVALNGAFLGGAIALKYMIMFVVGYLVALSRGINSPAVAAAPLVSYIICSVVVAPLLVYVLITRELISETQAPHVRFGLIALFFSLGLAAILAHPRQDLRSPNRKRRMGLIMKILGFSTWYVTLSMYAYLFFGIGLTLVVVFLDIRSMLHFTTAFWDTLSGWWGVNFLVTMALLADASAKFLRLYSSERTLRIAETAPTKNIGSRVLLLRSFHVDANFTYLKLHNWAWPWKDPAIYFEEKLAETINGQVGQLVALGNPDDYLPPLGAARDYSSDANWQENIIAKISDSDWIILLPGDTPGLSWELTYLRNNANPKRLIMLMPPLKFMDDFDWDEWSELTREAGLGSEMTEEDAGSIIIFADDWKTEKLCTQVDDHELQLRVLRAHIEGTFAGWSRRTKIALLSTDSAVKANIL